MIGALIALGVTVAAAALTLPFRHRHRMGALNTIENGHFPCADCGVLVKLTADLTPSLQLPRPDAATYAACVRVEKATAADEPRIDASAERRRAVAERAIVRNEAARRGGQV